MNASSLRSMFRCGCLLALWLIFGAVGYAGDVAGTYQCEGDAGGGHKYKGTVSITQKGDTYAVLWKLSGNETYTGIGVLQGDVLAVSYYGAMSGVIAYKVESDTRLVGKWAVVTGHGNISTEILTR